MLIINYYIPVLVFCCRKTGPVAKPSKLLRHTNFPNGNLILSGHYDISPSDLDFSLSWMVSCPNEPPLISADLLFTRSSTFCPTPLLSFCVLHSSPAFSLFPSTSDLSSVFFLLISPLLSSCHLHFLSLHSLSLILISPSFLSCPVLFHFREIKVFIISWNLEPCA